MIKMIAGVYGLPVTEKDGQKRIVGMGPNSGPFSIDPKREAELVAQKVAVYVDAPAPQVDNKDEAEAKSLSELSVKELREMAKERGLTFRVGMTKAAMIEALSEEPVDDEGGNANGDAPTFDPTEAVQ